jgi:hypothetical protein
VSSTDLDDAWILDGRHAATSLLGTLLHIYAPSRHIIVAHSAYHQAVKVDFVLLFRLLESEKFKVIILLVYSEYSMIRHLSTP